MFGALPAEVGEWPWHLRLLCCLGVFLLSGAAAWYGFGADSRHRLQQAIQQEQALRATYREKRRAVYALDSYASQVPALEARLAAHTRRLAMPGDDRLFAVLAQAARTAGVELRHVAVETRVPEERYRALPLQIKVAGEYAPLAAFVAELARLPQLLAPREFQLERGEAPLLLLQLLMRAYFLPEGAQEEGHPWAEQTGKEAGHDWRAMPPGIPEASLSPSEWPPPDTGDFPTGEP